MSYRMQTTTLLGFNAANHATVCAAAIAAISIVGSYIFSCTAQLAAVALTLLPADLSSASPVGAH